MEPIRIAIFEDNKDFRESLEFVVLSTPEYFQLGGSYKDASKLSDKIKTSDPHVVLMDINMPGINGIEAVKEIKSKFPAIQVCMQTVFEDTDKIFASLCAGASGYILKNAAPENILQAINEVAKGGAYFSPAIAKKVLNNFQQQTFSTEIIQLTAREKEILSYMVEGMGFKKIAAQCFISYETVHSHVKKIYEKLHVNSMSEAVSKAIRNRLV